MPLDSSALLGRELCRLEQDVVSDSDLSDVVNEGREAQDLELLGVKPHLRADAKRDPRFALAVRAGSVVTLSERSGEGRHALHDGLALGASLGIQPGPPLPVYSPDEGRRDQTHERETPAIASWFAFSINVTWTRWSA